MYCSLSEAFQSGPIPDMQRPSKKHRSRRSGMTATEGFLSGIPEPPNKQLMDPDRQAQRRPSPADLVGGGAGGTDQSMSYSNLLTATNGDERGEYFPHPHEDLPDADLKNAYMLEPDWTTAFKGSQVPSWIRDRVAKQEAEVPLKPSGWMDGMSTLWQRVPVPAVPEPASLPLALAPSQVTEDRLNSLESKLESKLERMFAKLEEIEKGRSEANHIEVIMFILGGLFLLLMLDMLVKQGTRASMMLAAAGGGHAFVRSVARGGAMW